MTEIHGRVIAAATDGACSGNPGPGGWAALMRFEDGSLEEFGGFEPMTTNNRMELQAALSLLERLKELPRHPDLKICSDSKYLIDGFSKWIEGWRRKGWRTAAGKPVLNKDLWEALDRARLQDVPIIHVKGHSGNPDNDRVDQIAVGYSKGTVPELKSLESSVKDKSVAKLIKELDQPASLNLQRLISKLEIADRLAQKGYGLTCHELAELVDQPIAQIKERTISWPWRDWLVVPLGEGRWRLKLQSNQQENS